METLQANPHRGTWEILDLGISKENSLDLNQYKDEVQLGGKVTVLTRGWVVTDQVDGTPKAGDIAYASNNASKGLIGLTASDADGSGNLAIGRFMSRKDADGYAKVYVNLPNFGK